VSPDPAGSAIPAESPAGAAASRVVVRAAPAAWLRYRGHRLAGGVDEFHGAVDLLKDDPAVGSLPPLVVLTSEQAPCPWSTRCRSCRWRSQQAGSLAEALQAAAAHPCPRSSP
jgi:hypothetical protein